MFKDNFFLYNLTIEQVPHEKEGRRCPCGKTLSIYNHENHCFVCLRKVAVAKANEFVKRSETNFKYRKPANEVKASL